MQLIEFTDSGLYCRAGNFYIDPWRSFALPRINRWRKDKKPNETNTLDDLKKMLEVYGK